MRDHGPDRLTEGRLRPRLADWAAGRGRSTRRTPEFDASATALPVTRGREAAELWRDYVECFERFRIGPLEFLDAGSGRIVVTVRDGGRMKGSDAGVHNEYPHVWTFGADDKITRWATFPTREEAIAHVGLEETT